jgi:hypothetical protein
MSVKATVITIICFLVGGGLGSAGTVVFLRSDAGVELLRAYVVQPPDWPDVEKLVQEKLGTTTSLAELAAARTKIPVPKSYATDAYAVALNSTVSDLKSIGLASTELGPVLAQLNAKGLTRDYDGLFDLVVKAKTLVTQQQVLSNSFARNISALSAANQATADVQLKSLTQQMTTVAEVVSKDLADYLRNLDAMLSGNMPTNEQILTLGQSATKLSVDIEAFMDVFNEILIRLTTAPGVKTQ